MTTSRPDNQQTGKPDHRSLTVWLSDCLFCYPLLVVLIVILCALIAQNTPTQSTIAIGWVGDRQFMQVNAGLGQAANERGDLYADDLTPDSPTGRSRWTRQHAQIVVPDIGQATDVEVALLIQGWPDDVTAVSNEYSKRQPQVEIQIDGSYAGQIEPSTEWETYRFTLPREARHTDALTIDTLTSATFTNTERGDDPRPKGIRIARVVISAKPGSIPAAPIWSLVGLAALAGLLIFALLRRWFQARRSAFLVMLVGLLLVLPIALARPWSGLSLTVVVWLVGLALAWQYRRWLLRPCWALVHHWRASFGLGVRAGLVVALAFLLTMIVAWSPTLRPNAPIYGIAGMLLVVALGRVPAVAKGCERILGWLQQPRIVLALLIVLGGTWLSWEASVITGLPCIGHADYADNAVVARNLVAGRSWVVDYVTQFYQIYPTLTHNQDTWPLLQPVWIAPFLALFGPQPWAAKIPNLIANGLLIWLIYIIGSRLWDRRIGLLAAVLTLTNQYFFRLAIYTTSDLIFVLLCTTAIYTLWRTVEKAEGRERESQTTKKPDDQKARRPQSRPRAFILPGVLTGLMLLQKPSGAVIAVGMGLWLFWQQIKLRRSAQQPVIEPGQEHKPTQWSAGFMAFWPSYLLIWALTALLILSPYLVRNMLLFQRPVFSTEQYDAWVLGYRGTSDEAWQDIYRVFAPELGGQGLPDRSWVQRWGFDATAAKFQTQLRALQDYFLPDFGRTPFISDLGSATHHKNLLSGLGAWLALAGAGMLAFRRRRLATLLLSAFMPYMLFMLVYWRTNEERYWVMTMPWLALLAAWALWKLIDHLARLDNRHWGLSALTLFCAVLVLIAQPSIEDIADKVWAEPALWQPDLKAYEWIRTNTAPDDAIMARNPWQLSWHAQRAALMIPNTPRRDLMLELARHYGVDYLIMESLLRVKSDAATVLAPLIDPPSPHVGMVVDGFELVYTDSAHQVFIYRLPPNDGVKR